MDNRLAIDRGGVTPRWIYENTSRSPELLSNQLNERLAAQFSARFLRQGFEPNTVTALGLLVHLVTAAVVLTLPLDSMLPAAVVVFLGWQLAYTLDCSDGQVARSSGKQSPEGAVIDLLADYLSHTIVLVIVWLKIVTLTGLAGDTVTAAAAALFALSGAGWFAALHNQALAGPGARRAGVLQRLIGDTVFFRVAYQVRHLMDTSLIITALAFAMALDGYALLAVFLIASGLRFTFIVTRFLGLLLLRGGTSISSQADSIG